MDDLMLDMQGRLKSLDISVKQIRKTAEDYANAERQYKLLLRKEALRLRDEGMAIGLIDKTIYGIPSVADARFARDVAEAVHKACLESINTQKLQIRILDAQIDREWKG